MYAFNDNSGKQFQITIDVFAARRIKQATGLSIETLIQANAVEKWDRVAIFEAILAACEPGKINVSDKEFAIMLSDGDVAERATEALQKAVIDFLPQRKRSLMHSLLSRQKAMEEKSLEAAPGLVDQMLSLQERSIEEARSRLQSSHLQGSPESAPPG